MLLLTLLALATMIQISQRMHSSIKPGIERSCSLFYQFTECYGFAWQGFGSGGYRGGFCEKLQEASPMPDKACASWL